MKKKLLVVASAALVLTSCGGGDSWKEYTYGEPYNFKIEFHGEPVFEADTIAHEDEGFDIYDYYWTEDLQETSIHENSFYEVNMSVYPGEYMHSDSLKEVVLGFLETTQESNHENSYKLVSQKETSIKGYPGLVFEWKNNDNDVYFEERVYMVENKLFHMMAISRPDKGKSNKNISRFLDSFELTSAPKAE